MLNFGICLVLLIGFINGTHSMSIKRNASPEQVRNTGEDMEVKYDEYPLVFPKRAAMLLDRLMVALHHALEDDDQTEIRKINKLMRNGQSVPSSSAKIHKGKTDYDAYYGYKVINGQTDDMDNFDSSEISDMGIGGGSSNEDGGFGESDDTMDLQRRGHSAGLGPNKGRVYWRCYFNAVTCF